MLRFFCCKKTLKVSSTVRAFFLVRSTSTSRQRPRDATPTPNQNPLSEVISNLSLFALSAGDQQSSSTYTAIPLRSPRTRGCSESSNCDVTKTATKQTFDQDWNKVSLILLLYARLFFFVVYSWQNIIFGAIMLAW